MRKLLIMMCFTATNVCNIVGPKFFEDYHNRYFVETGTYMGAGVEEAIKEGFSFIHSIEIDEKNALLAVEKFKEFKHVKIWHGDSTLLLKKVIEPIHEPITFWLDAHWGQKLQSDHLNTAILAELDQIKDHPIKNHTILIDDVRIFGTVFHNYITVNQLINKIKTINKNYRITFIDGTEKNDILVAQVA